MRSLVLAAALLAVPGSALAATYHVTTTGDDAAAGTAAAPWRTIQRAADAVAPGDTVSIHAGSYPGFVVTARGTEAAPIAFVGDGDVRILGAATAHRDAVLVQGGAWIRIEGLTVTGAQRAGISALDCDHVTVRRNRVDANGRWGVFSSFCDDLVVEDNVASRSGTEHGIYASNSADRPVIRRNVVWGNTRCGIHLNGDVHFGGDGVISGAVIEDNVITDNGRGGGSGINGDGVTGARIRNNVLDGNHASGISLYRIDGGAASTGNHVVNNTIRMASDGRWAINLQDGAGGNTLRNNILLHAGSARGAIDACATCVTGLVSDHNVVVGRFLVGGVPTDLAGWRARTGGDAATVVATAAALFTDPAAGDLTLRAGAPAIDRGVAAGAPARDIAGTPRPQGAAVDIGAYEACDGPCPPRDPDDPDGMPEPPGGEDPDAPDGAPPAPPAEADAGCASSGPPPGIVALLGLGATALALRRHVRARGSS